MRLIRLNHQLNGATPQGLIKGAVVTIGNFDGVHLGHQQLLKAVVNKANSLLLPSVVCVFEPQPQEYFQKDQAPARIFPFREKWRALKEAGIDYLFCLPFNEKLQKQSAQAFVDLVLIDHINTKHLFIGDDFKFGCDRAGDFDFLVKAGKNLGFTVDRTDTYRLQDKRVSSSRIRRLLADGDIQVATELMGRPYQLSGKVCHGKKLGRTIGVPTANIHLNQMPALEGVWLVKGHIGGQCYGVANIGKKPTVNGFTPMLEVHWFDIDKNLYAQRIWVEPLVKLRAVKKFDSFDALKQQIFRDMTLAKEHISGFSTSEPQVKTSND